MARRKVKNGEKSPRGQYLTRTVPNGRRRSAFWLGRKTQKFSGTNQKPEWRQPFGTGLVRHCRQGLFSPFFTFLRAIFLRPFRLSLAPTIYPWVSEDEKTFVPKQTNFLRQKQPEPNKNHIIAKTGKKTKRLRKSCLVSIDFCYLNKKRFPQVLKYK